MHPVEMAAAQAIPVIKEMGPLGLIGKVVGLGQEEIEEGIPWWGLMGAGFIAGGVVMYAFRDKLPKGSD